MVVLVIIGITSALAVLQRGNANEQLKRQNVARELKVAFERSRFDSVKRRGQNGTPDKRARVDVSENLFTLWTDTDKDGEPETSERLTTNLPTGVVINRYDGIALPVTVTFDMRGEISNATSAQFRVCNVTCSNATAATSDIVIVTPTGTVNLLTGDTTPPTFTPPSPSTVSTTAGINPDVVVTP